MREGVDWIWCTCFSHGAPFGHLVRVDLVSSYPKSRQFAWILSRTDLHERRRPNNRLHKATESIHSDSEEWAGHWGFFVD